MARVLRIIVLLPPKLITKHLLNLGNMFAKNSDIKFCVHYLCEAEQRRFTPYIESTPCFNFRTVFWHATNRSWSLMPTFYRVLEKLKGRFIWKNVLSQLSLRCFRAHSTRACLWASVSMGTFLGRLFKYPVLAKCLDTVLWDTSIPFVASFTAIVLVGMEESLRTYWPIARLAVSVIFFGRPLPLAWSTVPVFFSFSILSYIVLREMFVRACISLAVRTPSFHRNKIASHWLFFVAADILERYFDKKSKKTKGMGMWYEIATCLMFKLCLRDRKSDLNWPSYTDHHHVENFPVFFATHCNRAKYNDAHFQVFY